MRRFAYIFRVVLLAEIALFPVFLFAESQHVMIVQDEGVWKLLVNHRRFFIKGIGCQQASGEKGEDYLHMAHEMGANAVRTWAARRALIWIKRRKMI